MYDEIRPSELSGALTSESTKLNLLDLSNDFTKKNFKRKLQELQYPKEKGYSTDAASKEEYDRYPDDLKQMAKRATEIITKTGHFGHYGKREEIKDMFADAADKGIHAVEQLKKAINFEFKRGGAPYQIEGGYQNKHVTVEPEGTVARTLDGRALSYSVRTHTGADIKLINTGSQRTEDTLTVRGKELSRDYYSAGLGFLSEENRR